VVDLTGTAKGSLITVGNGVTLTLKNITLKGLNEAEGGNTAALIKVTSGGKLILGNGAVIRDNYNNDSSNYGGGVYVDGSGTFTMEGGEISGNTVTQRGGGVYVLDSGAFTMKNGEISGNNALRGGGVCVTDTGAFTMEGGKISGNNANDYGGGVYADQEGTSFTMEGGEINGNTVNVYNGGGVYVEAKGTFTMKNGEIRGNSSGTQSYGGGVCVGSNGKFTKNGGGTIDDTNLAKHGKVAYMFLYAGKKRDVAAGPEDDLDSNKSGDAGGWDAWY
jgi:parallel beta-helix repeat protein